MTDINPTFTLYNETIRNPGSSITSINGYFIENEKNEQIIRVTQTSIELWKFNKNLQTFEILINQQTFANNVSISKLCFDNIAKNYLVLTSDSGNLTLLEYNSKLNKFIDLNNEIFYKTGLRRLSPCKYSCIDPKGRAIMISAIEKNKLIFPLSNNDNDNNIIISSPIEANRDNILTYDIKSIDVGGYENNPIFAAIESEYGGDFKSINYYEYDLGLNNILLLKSRNIHDSSNHLIPLPGGDKGPSGIIVCSEGMIQYMAPFKENHYLPIPSRNDNNNNNNNIKSIIITSVVHQMKKGFFILLQNQFSDIFKITVDYEGWNVKCLKIRYFDTIPICNSICVLKNGYLYADCQFNDQILYKFEKLGDADGEMEWNSLNYPNEEIIRNKEANSFKFKVKKLENLKIVNKIKNFNPIIRINLSNGDFLTSFPEIYSICGIKSRSSLKILHKTIKLNEIITQELPSNILNTFCCKIHKNDKFDKFIILSFFDGSIILKIGDEVEEAENSGLLDKVSTLNIMQIGDHSIIQIHSNGIKQIIYNNNDEIIKSNDWNPSIDLQILKSSCTNNQVCLLLSNGELVYFELQNESLVEYTMHKNFKSSISHLAFISNEHFSKYIIVTCKDKSMHVISTDSKKMLENIDTVQLSNISNSFQIINDTVHIGLNNGVYVRYTLTDDGKLINKREKFIMASPLEIVVVSFSNVMIAVIKSATSFIVIPNDDDIDIVPLPIPEKFIEPEEEEDDEAEDEEEVEYSKIYGCIESIHSADVPQGLILAHGTRLTIASIDFPNDVKLEDIKRILKNDNIEDIPLRYTPRDLCCDLEKINGMSYIICSDSDILSPYQKGEGEEVITYDNEIYEEYDENIDYTYKEGNCGTCINVYSTEKCAIGQTIEILGGEMAIRIGYAKVDSIDYIFVSTIKEKKYFLRVYIVEEDGSLTFKHKTDFTNAVSSINSFKGFAIIGMNNELGLYSVGIKHILRKSSIKIPLGKITNIATNNKRIYVNGNDGMTVLEYLTDSSMFIILCQSSLPRHITSSVILDESTIIIGDKFGTISGWRVIEESDGEYMIEMIMSFYVGDVITSLIRGRLNQNNQECIIYSGINGTIGIMKPIISLKDINFFKEVENIIRNEGLCGLDNYKFRSCYVPKKACIDGDYLIMGDINKISNKLEMEINDVSKRLKSVKY